MGKNKNLLSLGSSLGRKKWAFLSCLAKGKVLSKEREAEAGLSVSTADGVGERTLRPRCGWGDSLGCQTCLLTRLFLNLKLPVRVIYSV